MTFIKKESRLHKMAKETMIQELKRKMDEYDSFPHFYYAGFFFPMGKVVEELEVRDKKGNIIFVPDIAILDVCGDLRLVYEIVHTSDISDQKFIRIIRNYPNCLIYKSYATSIFGGDSELSIEQQVKIYDMKTNPREGENRYGRVGDSIDIQALIDIISGKL